jgi:two-component system NtrC family response regulator
MATILIVDDDDAMREGLAETVTDLGYRPRLAASGKDALALVAGGGIDAVLLDLRMPGGLDGIEVLRRIRAGADAPPVVVLTAFAGADNTIEAMRLGAFDHLTKPIGRDDLKSVLLGMLAQRDPRPPPSRVEPSGGLIGASEAIRRVQKTIGLAADGTATVLILGETGTGKELVARALHEHGRRKDKAFIAVNCAAIPTELLESELFGHVKGAFTGAAADRAGAFREADGGTLFLDEIGDMPGAMQAKILRVLQDKVAHWRAGLGAAAARAARRYRAVSPAFSAAFSLDQSGQDLDRGRCRPSAGSFLAGKRARTQKHDRACGHTRARKYHRCRRSGHPLARYPRISAR